MSLNLFFFLIVLTYSQGWETGLKGYGETYLGFFFSFLLIY